jgi:4-amino-4-deoxy-L-arabinose transferase-like glycosyltransferase
VRRVTPIRAGPLAALPGVVVATILLVAQLPNDPIPSVTFSLSPWTDEAWSILGARNMALLGTWATDDFRAYLVQLPLHVALVGVFELAGVGIVQARSLSVVLTVATVALAALLVARQFGRTAGAVAGIGLASSALLLYYGRLAYLEPMVTFALVAGTAALLAGTERRWLSTGLAAGALLAVAVGTKPSAAAAVGGILGGAVLASWLGGEGAPRRVGTAVAAIAVAGIGWAILVGIPNREAIEATFRFWPQQTIPESPLDWVIRIGRYVRASDGANLLALPLYMAAGVGVLLSWIRWRKLTPPQRTMVGAALGWVVLGMVLIVVSAYRPNRYVVPILPGLAILGGIGATLLLDQLRASGARRGLGAAAIAAVLAVPGVVLWTTWMARATSRLPIIQEEVLAIIGDDAAVEGGVGPAFAMRAPVPTLLSRPSIGMNDGDLYAVHGVHWIVADESYTPAWAHLHRGAWEARETIRCWPWGGDDNECLIRVP